MYATSEAHRLLTSERFGDAVARRAGLEAECYTAAEALEQKYHLRQHAQASRKYLRMLAGQEA